MDRQHQDCSSTASISSRRPEQGLIAWALQVAQSGLVPGRANEPLVGGKSARAAPHVPGEAGLWVLIFGEMLFFATCFLTYLYYRSQEPSLFASSQQTLNRWNGVVLTLLLLTGSLLVVMAVRAVRLRLHRAAQKLLLGAIICGSTFSILKSIEYWSKLQDDVTPETNRFYMLYFVLTGAHFIHLILAIIVLTVLYRMLRNPKRSETRFSFIEGGACYWHMVDLVWIILFPLLYLVR